MSLQGHLTRYDKSIKTAKKEKSGCEKKKKIKNLKNKNIKTRRNKLKQYVIEYRIGIAKK